jgi:iron(III) transport system permease protein
MPALFRPHILRRQALFLLLLAALTLFLIWPIVLTVRGGFISPDGNFTFQYIQSIFRDPLLIQGLINSFLIASVTTLLSLLLALPLSILTARYDFPGKTLFAGLVLLPLILPPFVGAIGLQALLGRFGALNTLLQSIAILDPAQPGIDFLGGAVGGRFWGVVVMEALHLYPILYLNITAALANLDPTLEEAAINLGASRLRRFFRCTLPLILPGIFAGATIVFIWSFTELGTPLMFDYYTVTPVQIFWGITEIADNPRPFALVVVMLAVVLLLYLLGRWAFGGRAYAMHSKASIASTPKRLSLTQSILAISAFAFVTALAILPHLGVILSSFSANGAWYRSILPAHLTTAHYAQALSHPLAMRSITNSFLYAAAAMALCLLLGVAIARLTIRHRIKGAWLLDSLAMLPLAVPGLVLAFGYVAMTLHWPFAPGDPLQNLFSVVGQAPNPIPLLIIAYAVRRLPYVVRAVAAGLQQTSSELEDAAQSLGANSLTTIRRIILPLIMANLVAAAILVFSFSMLEVSDSLVLAQKQEHFPITKAIWELFNRLGDGPYIASAMGVWGMALLTVTLLGASILLGKRLGALFRV